MVAVLGACRQLNDVRHTRGPLQKPELASKSYCELGRLLAVSLVSAFLAWPASAPFGLSCR